MSRQTDPKIRYHKHTNRAYVELSVHSFYLGKWYGSKKELTRETQVRYHELLAQWKRAGRTPIHAKPIPATAPWPLGSSRIDRTPE